MFIVLLIVFVIYGIVSLAAPEAIWELEERMRYKDSDREPSTAALVMIRLSGVLMTGVAIFGIFQSCSSGGM
ncbi:hypothetical protein D7X94_01230 [Acutalibacter sp. 1XD8-33]|uniref:DUF6199 family natural product biosynthesis protein n=1 Tax=Acutalibacter sp. 1XD8-33 TaxID=2320081 RepID=UPI000EA40558|nr:DUF6199 family natural product biosynthesis protein [Acutalibacter sp. 1XD8-33]RKJ42125.1 hypothetical protein D7X94_01230 [Acutalibacter sp. 1XD8-33]